MGFALTDVAALNRTAATLEALAERIRAGAKGLGALGVVEIDLNNEGGMRDGLYGIERWTIDIEQQVAALQRPRLSDIPHKPGRRQVIFAKGKKGAAARASD